MEPPGTVFIIPADEHHGVLGQIIAEPIGPNPHLLAAFRAVHPISECENREILQSLLTQQPAILANSFDILIQNRGWKNVGVFPVAEVNRVFPKFKSPSLIPFLARVESYDRTRTCVTLPFLVRGIPRRFSISAKLFEVLALAANGHGTWNRKYDKVLFEGMAVTRSVDAV